MSGGSGSEEQRLPGYAAALEQSDEATYVASLPSDGSVPRFKYVNDAFCSLCQYDREQLIGREVTMLLGKPDLQDGDSSPADLAGLADPVRGICLQRRDGTAFWVSPLLSFLTPPDGDPVLVVKLCDIADDVSPSDEPAPHGDAPAHGGERRFQALVRSSSDMVVLTDQRGVVRYASPAVGRILGLPPDSGIEGAELLTMVHAADATRARDLLDITLALPRRSISERVELRLRSLTGQWLSIEMVGINLLDDPDVGCLVFNGHDVSERRQREQLLVEQAELLESMARGAPLDAVLLRSVRMVERRLTGSAASIGLLDAEGVLRPAYGPSLSRRSNEALDRSDPDSDIGRALRVTGKMTVFRDITSDQSWTEIREPLVEEGFRSCWTFPLEAPGSGSLVGVLAVFTRQPRGPRGDEVEICERALSLAAVAIDRRRSEERLRHQALHDELTGLPNRTLLIDRTQQALARARRHGVDVAVLFVDLDQFKVINDSLGHAAGDLVLKEVAERFKLAVRDGDTVGRFGGDEFVVLCEDVAGESGAIELADRLAEEMQVPFDVSGTSVVMTASIGIALLSSDVDGERDADALIRDADVAMYQAKERGRAGHAVFEPALHERVVQRLELEAALRAALTDGHLVVHYQPQVRLIDAAVVGVEALVRWERPGHGLVLPDHFIPTAEDTGLIIPLDRWVLDEACRQVARWRKRGLADDLLLSVNISAHQLSDVDLPDVVSGILAAHGLPPGVLALEVTESALAVDVEGAAKGLDRLHELGVRLSIDDFGTGYASLESVRRLAMADELKIDRSFVADLEGRLPRDRAIVWASVVLARALGFTAVAEGVETDRQRTALLELGCDIAQGYLFGRPMPAAELEVVLRARASFVGER